MIKIIKILLFLITYNLIGYIGFEESHKIPQKKSSSLDTLKRCYEENKYKIDNDSIPKKIPKIIHQIWIGPNELPSKFKDMTKVWELSHPDWTYKLWTNKDIEDFINKNSSRKEELKLREFKNIKLFNSVYNWGGKSDILRYEILNQFGGVYLDIDFAFVKKLDPLNVFDFYCCIVPEQIDIANGVLGGIPGHPIFLECIKELSKLNGLIHKNNFMEIWEKLGPGLMTKTVMKFLTGNQNSNIITLTSDHFFPFPATLRHRKLSNEDILRYKKKCSFAVHFWGTTWQR